MWGIEIEVLDHLLTFGSTFVGNGTFLVIGPRRGETAFSIPKSSNKFCHYDFISLLNWSTWVLIRKVEPSCVSAEGDMFS